MSVLLRCRVLRRLLTIPAVVLVFGFVAITMPLWAFVTVALSPLLPGRWRPLRFAWFALLWLGLEVAALIALGWLWLIHGAGRRLDTPAAVDAHYRLLGVLLGWLSRSAQRLFAVRVELEDAALPASRVLPSVPVRPRPLLVLSRHAGPGDSFLLVHELVTVYRRQPRIVLKDVLQLDPAIDVLVNRLPSRFISPEPRAGDEAAATVGALAEGMDSDDALLLFPEGGNFTERRRQRSIARLEASGWAVHAALARRMRHLVAPRPGGVLAVLDAAPDADVVFVAHTGLEQLDSVLDLWCGLPMDREIRARFWTVTARDVPRGRDERIAWLYQWWARLDAWIDERQPRTQNSPPSC
ncbi:MAG: 1-acyl-sn-glycerol-3-phosphate acyltransferase [Egibacteraceae bacterium]